MTSTEHSFESCDRSTFDKDYCPSTDDSFSDSNFEDMVITSAREKVVQNTEDCSNNNVKDSVVLVLDCPWWWA